MIDNFLEDLSMSYGNEMDMDMEMEKYTYR